MRIEQGLVLEQLIFMSDGTASLTNIIHRPIDNIIGRALGKAHNNSFLDIDSESALRNSEDGGGNRQESHLVGDGW